MTTSAKLICALALGIIFLLSLSNRPDKGSGLLADSLESIKQSVLSVTDGVREIADTVPFIATEPDKAMSKGNGRKIYRWQDAQGNWHYSDSPPAGVKSEIMTPAEASIMSLAGKEAVSDEDQ